jgi:AraC-like DNA-binding protein/DNA-binding winged helix-turn-helix (wHTH) protein
VWVVLNHASFFPLGDWQVNPRTNTLRKGELVKALEPKAMDVLRLLYTHKGQVLRADDIADKCWGDVDIGDNPVHKAINVLLVEINSADKQQLGLALKKLGYTPIEISTAENNNSRISKIEYDKISNSCLIIVDAKNHGQTVMKSVHEAQNAIFSETGLHRPVLSLVDFNKSNKHELYALGAFDYLSYPIIPQELTLRITHAINYFEAAQAPLHAFILPSQAHKEVATPLIKKKAQALAENTAAYLQTKLGEDIKLCELIVKMGTNRNKLNDAFKTSYGLTVFAWLLKKRMSLAQKLLKTTTLSILQVGDQVGYPDSNNFSTAFKREYQLSPKHYRQSLS